MFKLIKRVLFLYIHDIAFSSIKLRRTDFQNASEAKKKHALFKSFVSKGFGMSQRTFADVKQDKYFWSNMGAHKKEITSDIIPLHLRDFPLISKE